MNNVDIVDALVMVGLVAAGVIVAGLIMKWGRDSVPFLMEASDGFDT